MSGISRVLAASVLAVSLLATRTGAQGAASVASNEEIRRVLIERIDKYRQSVGIVVGVIEPQGKRVVAYGSLAAGDARPLNGDTVFEIGSITKVFTALLLADMVERHEVSLSDPAAKYLPRNLRMPLPEGREIDLEDLATHTSGLPRMPGNVEATDALNPYKDYSVQYLYEFLNSYRLPRDVASTFEYSNVGGALLGHVLAESAGLDYSELIQSRIVEPLGMKSTRITLTPAMQDRMAVGHVYSLEPTPNWDLGALDAAAGLRSTVNDLLLFLEANLGYRKTPLAPAMDAMLQVRRETPTGEVALGWFVEKRKGVQIVLHDGGTGGYRSFIGYDPKTHVGVVVLSNNGGGAGVEDIGVHLLSPQEPLLDGDVLTPPKVRREVPVNSALLDSYAGKYRFPSSQMAKITHQDGRLLLHAEGEVPITFFPEGEREFFAKIMDAQLTFRTDAQGHVLEMLFHRDGATHQVSRID